GPSGDSVYVGRVGSGGNLAAEPSAPRLVSGLDGSGGEHIEHPWLSANGDRVWLAWTATQGPASAVRFVFSDDGGQTFRGPFNANTASVSPVHFATLATSDNGWTYLAFMQETTSPPSRSIMAMRFLAHEAEIGFSELRTVAGSKDVLDAPIAS